MYFYLYLLTAAKKRLGGMWRGGRQETAERRCGAAKPRHTASRIYADLLNSWSFFCYSLI